MHEEVESKKSNFLSKLYKYLLNCILYKKNQYFDKKCMCCRYFLENLDLNSSNNLKNHRSYNYNQNLYKISIYYSQNFSIYLINLSKNLIILSNIKFY